MIRNVVFDLGGVIITLDRRRAVERFERMGLKAVDELLDVYEQQGVFLELETGQIDAEGFRCKLSEMVGKEVTTEEVVAGWLGFMLDVPQHKLDYIEALRKKYKVFLLSNTNPIVVEWAESKDFCPAGRPLSSYFDKVYMSYRMGVTKPNANIFLRMMEDAGIHANETLFVDDGIRNIETAARLGMHTYLATNGEEWHSSVEAILLSE
ncbi:MAG: HAD family phosphatase [Tannerellaceae bacterium]|jgi:putative hydrolase of the HAD superfamily|nr:HAD family phosphatase [Tannerellaceae bacterium]